MKSSSVKPEWLRQNWKIIQILEFRNNCHENAILGTRQNPVTPDIFLLKFIFLIFVENLLKLQVLIKQSLIDKGDLSVSADIPWWSEFISVENHSVAIRSRSNCIGPVLKSLFSWVGWDVVIRTTICDIIRRLRLFVRDFKYLMSFVRRWKSSTICYTEFELHPDFK